MIVRTVKNKENPYFLLNRTAANDDRLSYKAIGIHTYLMSKPDSWQANEEDIIKRHTDGRSSVRSGIAELRKYGYMARVQEKDEKGKFLPARIDTYESPELNPYFTGVLSDDDLNNQDNEPVCDFPTAGFPTAGFPTAGNRPLVINDSSKELNKNILVAKQPQQEPAQAALDKPSTCSGKDLKSIEDDLADIFSDCLPVNQAETTKRPKVVKGKEKPAKKASTAYVNPLTGFGTNDIYSAYEEMLAMKEPGAVINVPAEKKAAKLLAQNGKTPAEVKIVFAILKADRFHSSKHLALSTIATNMAAVIAGRNELQQPRQNEWGQTQKNAQPPVYGANGVAGNTTYRTVTELER